MTRLSDRDILVALEKGRIRFTNGPSLEDISGCTIDLHLGYGFRVFNAHTVGHIDCAHFPQAMIDQAMSGEIIVMPPDAFFLHPGELALGATMESVTIGNDLVGWLDGRSSLARLGLMVHMTAHRIDPGWSGEIVLEFFNAGKFPIILRPAMPIAAISFETLSSPALWPYGKRQKAKYQNQQGPVASRFCLNAFCSTNSSEPLTEGWPGLERYGRAVEKLVMSDKNRKFEKDTVINKLPVGVMPEKRWKESRVFDLMECMIRRHNERTSSEEQYGIWMNELRRLLNEIQFMD